jgi:hypothetical protein
VVRENMSSFLVSPDVLNRIVTFLDTVGSSDSIHSYGIARLLEEYGFDVGAHDFTERMFSILLETNLDGLSERYGHGTGPDDLKFSKSKGVKYQYQFRHSDPIQVYQDVRCLSYQCAEGHVVELDEYRFLEELENRIAHYILSPMTEKLSWGS